MTPAILSRTAPTDRGGPLQPSRLPIPPAQLTSTNVVGSLGHPTIFTPVEITTPQTSAPRLGYPWRLERISLPLIFAASAGSNPTTVESAIITIDLMQSGVPVLSETLQSDTSFRVGATNFFYWSTLALNTDFQNPIYYTGGESLQLAARARNPLDVATNLILALGYQTNNALSGNLATDLAPVGGNIAYSIPV